MTGWDLLESLSELADNKDEVLEREIYIKVEDHGQSIFRKPTNIDVKFDRISQNRGIFIQ